MKCPYCGSSEETRVRVCQSCGNAYASEDLLELHQLEYLLAETADWPEVAGQRRPYADRLTALKARILPAPPLPAAAIEAAAMIPQPALPPLAPEVEPSPARPAPEPIPFDQWLLSERNIKIALYTGGALLVAAGLIFVGVNWAYLSGLTKFAITLMITVAMYLGGYLLFQRSTLRLGGVALVGVGAGFVPLNFVVLQIYIFSERGLSANTMWLIGSLLTLLLYLLTVYWTRADLFTYLCMGAVASLVTAALVVSGAPAFSFFLAHALLLLVFLFGARAVQFTWVESFTRVPLMIVSQITMPLLFVSSALVWAAETGCDPCRQGSPWLALAAMFIGVAFYVTTDIVFGRLFARWLAAFTFAVTFVFFLIELRFSGTATGIVLMVAASIYLLLGYALEERAGRRAAAWPLYAAGYALAAFVTIQALLAFREDPVNLARTLIGDVLILALSAWVHRRYVWIYGAAWLLIAPVFIYASLYVHGRPSQGSVLFVLMLIYVAAGYMVGRRALRLSGPFLTAAAFLSLVVIVLTWANAVVASITLGFIAVLYLAIALWLGWSWLLLPALVAVNIALLAILRMVFAAEPPSQQMVTVIYAGLAIALAMGGAWLRQRGQRAWAWPLYLVAALDLVASYVAALLLGGATAIGLSLSFALLAFGLAWVERAALAHPRIPPLLTYFGAGFIFAGHFYVIELSNQAWQFWPAYTAGLCALLIVLAWLLRHEPVRDLYGSPLRWAGLVLMAVPLGGAIYLLEPPLGTATFGIAGIAYAADATVRRIPRLGYLAGAAFIASIWDLLLYYEVLELQAYVIPLGLGLLVLGWNEGRMGSRAFYRLSTLLGLLVLMGAAFYQSLDSVSYAVLLLGESLAVLAWGVRIHSRGYVQIGVLSLIANAIAQFGPGFVELPRWIQLGVIGSILLGGGLMALFRREQLLAIRRRLTDEWRHEQV
jgi:hypothetical protein